MSLPKGSKKVAIIDKNGEVVDDGLFESLENGNTDLAGVEIVLKVGIPWTPDDFLGKAVQCIHPFDDLRQVKDEIGRAVFNALIEGPSATARRRNSMLLYYRQRERELRKKEDELHARMDDDVAKIMRSKRLLLFKEVMSDAGYIDKELFGDLVGGFPIIGVMSDSGNFEPR
eukprot:8858656-Karenia_brevis.AAC.1